MDLRGVRIAIAKQTLSRELRAMGYRKLRTAAPLRAPRARSMILKSFPARLTQSRVRRRSASTR
jgi:hypothetical protein